MDRDTGTVSSVLKDIAEEFLLRQNINFQTIIGGAISRYSVDIVDNFLSTMDDERPKLIHRHFDYPIREPCPGFPIFYSTFLFYETLYDFYYADHVYQPFRYHDQPMVFIIVIRTLTLYQLKTSRLIHERKKLSYFADGVFVNSLFVINEKDAIILATSEWFSADVCNICHIRVLNWFDKKMMAWHKKLQNYEKFLEYHGCELVMMVATLDRDEVLYHLSGYVGIRSDTKKREVLGISPKNFEIASKLYNFSVDYQPSRIPFDFLKTIEYNDLALAHENGSIKMPDVYFEMIPTYGKSRDIRHSNFFVTLKNYILVTPADAYSPYERMTLPFDLTTWILLFVTFGITFLTILIINRLSYRARNIVYGYKIENPFWNVVSIFFGISQTRLPVQNFPRFILTLFIIFCLIFRTCFQSKFFELMTIQLRKAPPKTLADIIDRNYKLYAIYDNEILNHVKDEYGRSLDINYAGAHAFTQAILTQSQNSSARLALITDDLFQNHYENYFKFNFEWNRIQEDLFSSQEAFGFQQFTFSYRMFKKMVDRLIDSGVMSYLANRFYTKKIKFEKPKKHPLVLTIESLAFGFNIWIGFCILSIAAFVIEIIIQKCKKNCSKKAKKNNLKRMLNGKFKGKVKEKVKGKVKEKVKGKVK